MRKLHAIQWVVSASEELNCKVCIMNQANQGITRIIFQIQKIEALLSVTPATKKERRNQTAQMKCHRMLIMVVISLQHISKLANQVCRSTVF